MTEWFEDVRSVLSQMSGVAAEDIHPNTRLRFDLHLSDLQMIALGNWVEDRWAVSLTDEDWEGIQTASDVSWLTERK